MEQRLLPWRYVTETGRQQISRQLELDRVSVAPSCAFYAITIAIPKFPPPPRETSRLPDAYVVYMDKELTRYGRTERFRGRPCGAIYLDGHLGVVPTPAQMARLLHVMMTSFTIGANAEITLAGPAAVLTAAAYLKAIKQMGVTRVALSPATSRPTGDDLRAIGNAVDVGIATVTAPCLCARCGRYEQLVNEQGCEVIGIGAGVQSYIHGIRFVAPLHVETYQRRVAEGDFPALVRYARTPKAIPDPPDLSDPVVTDRGNRASREYVPDALQDRATPQLLESSPLRTSLLT